MDVIEEANNNIRAEIDRYERNLKMSESEKEERIKQLQNELLIKKNMEQKEQEITSKEQALKSI